MINIYTDIRLIPNNKVLINDVESYFSLHYDGEVSAVPSEVISHIDESELKSNNLVLSRFGTAIYLDDISTGAKALISAQCCDDNDVVSLVELSPISSSAISYLTNGNLYIPYYAKFYNTDEMTDIYVNGIKCQDYEEASFLTGCNIHDINTQRSYMV